MITLLNISEFRGYDRQSLHQYLALAPTKFFDIVLPKTSHLNSMGARAVYEDFCLAFHLSQGLQRISYDITCTYCDVHEPGKLSLLLITDRLEELAELLYPYVNGFDVHGRPTLALLSHVGTPDLAPGEEIACDHYHEVYMALRDSDCSPYVLSEY